MNEIPHRRSIRIRFALVALFVLAFFLPASSSSGAVQSSGCMIEPWYCNPGGGLEPCMIEPWVCFETEPASCSEEFGSYIVVFWDWVEDPAALAHAQVEKYGGKLGFIYKYALKGYSAQYPRNVVASVAGELSVKYITEDRPVELFGVSSGGQVTSLSEGCGEEEEQFALKVEKTGSGSGTVTSTPTGIECGGSCDAEFDEGATVALTASPSAGFVFSGWKGCEVVDGRECTVTMNAAKTVLAKFALVETLAVGKAGTGLGLVKTYPSGISCQAACDSAVAEFPSSPAKEVTLTATPYKGSTFVAWGGDCLGSAPTCKVTLAEARSVTAEFAPVPKVALTLDKVSGVGTVKSSPASINCAATCSTQTSGFLEGTEVELTATPYKSTFVQWTGACSGPSLTCKVTMSEAKTVGAEFTGALAGSVPLTLKKTASSTGTGKLQTSPGGVNCDARCMASAAVFKPGAKVVLKQMPSKDSTFVEWVGACSGSGTCEVMLSEAREVTAEFEAIPARILTVNKSGGGTGTVKTTPAGVNCGLNCPQASAFYLQTASVTLMAAPGKGSGPVQWTGCDEVTGGLCIARMASAKEVTAKFE